MNKFDSFSQRIFAKIVRFPIKARHTELSVLSSADDELSKPNDFLISLSIKAIKNAQKINLKNITIKNPYTDVWPGEHYKLLAGLVLALKPKVVVELGTGEGLSALSMKKHLPKGSKLVTFDIIPYNKLPNNYLKHSDFDDSFIQSTDDLTSYSTMLKHKNLLQSADFIFIDAAKDGEMEYKFLKNLARIGLKPNTIIAFDDIHVWNMLAFWRNIKHPKIDVSSFGHWSGTGIIQWQNK